jgi:hypothetical protein
MLTVQGNARGAAARAPRTSPVERSRRRGFEVVVKIISAERAYERIVPTFVDVAREQSVESKERASG